jgi:hypothetical protein
MTTRSDVLRTMLPRSREWTTKDILKVLSYCSTVPEPDLILACCNAILRKDIYIEDEDIVKAFNFIINILRRRKGEAVEEACARLLELVVKSDWEISFPLLDAAQTELANYPAVNTLSEFEIITNTDSLPKLVSDCSSSPRSNFISACWSKISIHISDFEVESVVASVVEAFSRPAGLSTAAQIEGTKLLAIAASKNPAVVASALSSRDTSFLPTLEELNLLQEMKMHFMNAWEMSERSTHEGFIGACWEGYEMAPKPSLKMIELIAKTVNRPGVSTYLEHLGSKIAGVIAKEIIRRDKNDRVFVKMTTCLNRILDEAAGARYRGVIHQLLYAWIQYAQTLCFREKSFCEQLNTLPELQIFLTEALTPEAIAEVDFIAQEALDLIEQICEDDVNCLAVRLRGIENHDSWTIKEKATFLDMRELIISKQLEEAAAAKHVKAIFEYKTPLYYMGGHGRSLPGTFVVPPGCTLVTTTLFGVLSSSKVGCRMRELFSDASNRDILLRIELPTSREEIRRRLYLPEGHNVHVYTAGTLAPNMSYFPGNYANIGGVLKFPIEPINNELKYNDADPCARFSAGQKNEDVPLETDVLMAKFGQSLYPTPSQILEEFPKPSQRTTAAIGETFEIPVSEIMKRFKRGVYYFTACRTGELLKAVKELVPRTDILVSPSAAFDFVASHRADLDRKTLDELRRLRDKDVSIGLEEAVRFSRLPGAHRKTRSSDVVVAKNAPLGGIAYYDGFL